MIHLTDRQLIRININFIFRHDIFRYYLLTKDKSNPVVSEKYKASVELRFKYLMFDTNVLFCSHSTFFSTSALFLCLAILFYHSPISINDIKSGGQPGFTDAP